MMQNRSQENSTIPDEIWRHIFQWLSFKEIVMVYGVNRKFRELVKSIYAEAIAKTPNIVNQNQVKPIILGIKDTTSHYYIIGILKKLASQGSMPVKFTEGEILNTTLFDSHPQLALLLVKPLPNAVNLLAEKFRKDKGIYLKWLAMCPMRFKQIVRSYRGDTNDTNDMLDFIIAATSANPEFLSLGLIRIINSYFLSSDFVIRAINACWEATKDVEIRCKYVKNVLLAQARQKQDQEPAAAVIRHLAKLCAKETDKTYKNLLKKYQNRRNMPFSV